VIIPEHRRLTPYVEPGGDVWSAVYRWETCPGSGREGESVPDVEALGLGIRDAWCCTGCSYHVATLAEPLHKVVIEGKIDV
jgi:hypothetical protein